jgi:oxygen-dependent protoporphyrinogen oxidase
VEHWLHASGTPQLVRVVRWPHAMPQYELGHLMLVEAIERQLAGLPGLALAGNYLRGVGVPQCVHSGEQAAEALVNGRRL